MHPEYTPPTDQGRYCTACETVKPRDQFHRRKDGRDGLDSHCKACSKATRPTAWATKRCTGCGETKPREAFPPNGTASNGKPAIRPRCRECAREADRQEYHRNHLAHMQRARAYRQANRTRLYASQRRWRMENREKGRDKWDRRRARQMGAAVVEHIDRKAIIARDNQTCYLCGEFVVRAELTLDHVVPLARGGNHAADNLRVAHRSCNSRKYLTPLAELDWVRKDGDECP